MRTTIWIAMIAVSGLMAGYSHARLGAQRVSEEDRPSIPSAHEALPSIGSQFAISDDDARFVFAGRALRLGEFIDDPSGAFVSDDAIGEKLRGVVVTRRHGLNDPLRADGLYRLKKPAVATSAKLAKDHRVVGLLLNLKSASGFVSWPGTTVDIINTDRKSEKSFARFLVEKVDVIDVDERAVGNTALFLLDFSPEHWRQLCDADDLGILTVALRKSDRPVVSANRFRATSSVGRRFLRCRRSTESDPA